jgi:hypothetical protein
VRIWTKRPALGALAGNPRAGNQGGSAQRITSGTEISTAARGRQIARPRLTRFDRTLSWQLDAALYLEETAGARFDRWLARLLRRRLEAPLPRWAR